MIRRSAVLLLIAASCASSPELVLESVEPTEMIASEGATLTLKATGVLPTYADYVRGTIAVQPRVTVWLGGESLGTFSWGEDGILSVPIPTLFSAGRYDVRIILEDDREAVLQEAFEVKPGQWPDGYDIDTIPEQIADVPFNVTLRAKGTNAATFGGTVRLRSNRGRIQPEVSGRFTDGVRVEVVTIERSVNNAQLTCEDGGGKTGTSNAFRVR